jgi:hypothetical protein
MIAPSQLPYMARSEPKIRPGAPLTRLPQRRARVTPVSEVAIRLADRRDAGAVRELEQLDGRELSCGARLLALVGGIPVAALSVADDKVVADPFEKTAPVVDLLRVRARQLRIAGIPQAA